MLGLAADFRVRVYSCAQAHLVGWRGGMSRNPFIPGHIHISYAPGTREFGVAFCHRGYTASDGCAAHQGYLGRMPAAGDTRLRQPRRRDPDYLGWLHGLPCLLTGRTGDGIHAAHIRYGDACFGKRQCGLGERPDDRWALPLWHSLHVGDRHSQHAAGERRWWDRIGVDPVVVAAALYLHWIRHRDEFDQGACAILAEWRPDRPFETGGLDMVQHNRSMESLSEP